jgi:hypothetical protein
MTIFNFLAGAGALGALAAPAAAQYNPYPGQQGYDYPAYPGQPYPQQHPQQYPQQYPGYGYGQGYTGNPVTDIIDQLLGNRYSVTDRQAVRQCARAATSQAASQYGGYGGYGGYNQGYRGQGYGAFRVTAITDVQRRSYGLRVSGLLGSGGSYGGYGGGYGGQYGYQDRGYARGDLSFRCNVDYRGAVTSLRVRPAGYR